MRHFRILPLLLLATTAAAAAPRAAMVTRGAADISSFQKEFEANLADVEDKILRLAEATPAAKFVWRPADDVRSISEVYMHIAGANYLLPTFVGIDAPKNAEDIETRLTKKEDVIAELKRSFKHLRNAATTVRDLEKPVKMFGSQTTYRGVLLTALNHLHEHLGQSIAYARMNGVKPPWS